MIGRLTDFNTVTIKNITGFWAEFEYGKYLIVSIFSGISGPFVLAKIRTMGRPNSPDMPPKRISKIRLGIITACARAHSDFGEGGGGGSSCPKKLHNARMCKR